MNWLFPSFAGAALAALLPVLLHLFRKRRRKQTEFPSLKFFGQISVVDQRKQRIRRWIVLLLRCAVFGLLVAAFARPFFPRTASGNTRATIIVLDNSFSMRAAERWPWLRNWTLGLLAKATPEETIGLLLMNPKPTWLVPPTRDVKAVALAVERFQPGWLGTQAMPALRFAGEILAAGSADERRIVVVSDQQASGWLNADFTAKLPPGVGLMLSPPVDPVRLQAALWTPSVQREGDKVTVSIPVKTYTGSGERTLSLYAGNQLLAISSKTIRLEGGAFQTVVLSGSFPADEKWIRCELAADDLVADNVAYALVPALEQAQVVLLDAMPADAVTDYLATACEELGKIPPGWKVLPASAIEWPTGAVLFLRNEASFSGAAASRLENYLQAGGAAVVFATGGEAQTRWLAKHRLPIIAQPAKVRLRDWSVEHPLVAPLAEYSLRTLIGWRFARGWTLPADAIEPLAFWDDGSPALGELTVGNGRVLVAGFGPDRRDGNWPVEGAFLPFIHRSAQYLLDARVRAPDAVARVGSPLSLPEGEGHWTAVAGVEMGGKPREVHGYVTPSAPGVFEWSGPRGAKRLFVVGLSPEESDPTAVQGTPWMQLVSTEAVPKKIKAQNTLLAAEETEHQQKLWWWALVVVVFGLVIELGISNRTAR
ncbi:MAG: BatA and WFA domain-containing protein [Nibricoccus sp.]